MSGLAATRSSVRSGPEEWRQRGACNFRGYAARSISIERTKLIAKSLFGLASTRFTKNESRRPSSRTDDCRQSRWRWAMEATTDASPRRLARLAGSLPMSPLVFFGAYCR